MLDICVVDCIFCQMEIPRAFVCAESKIFDVSEWAICQVILPNLHTYFFSVLVMKLALYVYRQG